MDIMTQIRDAFQDGDDTVKDAALERAATEIEKLRSLADAINTIEQNAYSLRDCDQGMKAIRKILADYSE